MALSGNGNRTHWICAKVAPAVYRAAKHPPRFAWTRLGIVPSIGGETYRIHVGALVDALSSSAALARFKLVYPGAEVEFCSPKSSGFRPAGFINWRNVEPDTWHEQSDRVAFASKAPRVRCAARLS